MIGIELFFMPYEANEMLIGLMGLLNNKRHALSSVFFSIVFVADNKALCWYM